MNVHCQQDYDVAYNADNCTVIYNERLLNDTNEISRLLLDCDAFEFESDFSVKNTMNSSVTD